MAIVAPGPAVFLGQRQAQKTRRPGLEPQIAVDDAVFAPAGGVGRRGVLVEETPHGVGENVEVFLGQEGRAFDVEYGHVS